MNNSGKPPYSEQPENPENQAANAARQKEQLDQYRREVINNPERNTGLPGFEKNPGKQSNSNWHKSSQDKEMLGKDDRILDDDNNIRKDADVNLDSRESGTHR